MNEKELYEKELNKKEGTAPDLAPEGLTSIFAARPVVAIGRASFFFIAQYP